MFRRIMRCVVITAALSCATPLLADETLPPPQQSGGMGVFDALKKRSSAAGGDFSPAEVTRQELSTILWAATGLNRGSKGWTVPMWRGMPPYCRVYVAADEGVFLYDWATHSLREISKENIKGKIGRQSFVKKAFFSLIFVADAAALSTLKDEALRTELSFAAAGAMTQNVYLAGAALKIGARYIRTIQPDEIARALNLPAGDIPLCLMLLGK